METKHPLVKKIVRLTISMALIVSLSGCATFREMTEWIAFWDNGDDITLIPDESIARFVSSIRPQSNDIETRYRLATFFQRRGKHKLAIEEFRAILVADPGYVKAYNGMGVSFDIIGDYAKAVKAYTTALALQPELAYIHNNLGYSYLLQGRLEEAAGSFQTALELAPGNYKYQNNLELAYARQGYRAPAEGTPTSPDDTDVSETAVATSFQNDLLPVETETPAVEIEELQLPTDPNPAELAISLKTSEMETGSDQSPEDMLKTPAPPAFTSFPSLEEKRIHPQPSHPEISDSMVESNGMVVSNMTSIEEIQIDKVHYSNSNGNNKYYRVSLRAAVSGSVANNDLDPVAVQAAFKPAHDLRSEPRQGDVERASSMSTSLHPGRLTDSDPLEFNEEIDWKSFGIEISNGNGVNRMARRMGNFLNQKGLNVIRLTNADHFNHPDTRVYFQKGYLYEAFQLAQQLPGNQEMRRVPRLDRPTLKIKVVIGKDIVPFDAELRQTSLDL